MQTFGYGLVVVGALLFRQIMVGRVKETPQDFRDLFVALINADLAGAESVLSARGENVSGADSVAAGTAPLTTGAGANAIGSKAIAWGVHEAKSGHTGWHYRCLAFVQMCYTQGAGIKQSSRGTAANAAAMAKYMHKGADFNSIPPGVPVYWGGGSGHVALSLGYGGGLSTDHPTDDIANVTTLAEIDAWLGDSHPYIGWSEDSCGTRVYGGNTMDAGEAGNRR